MTFWPAVQPIENLRNEEIRQQCNSPRTLMQLWKEINAATVHKPNPPATLTQ